jgi:hypothetical protein
MKTSIHLCALGFVAALGAVGDSRGAELRFTNNSSEPVYVATAFYWTRGVDWEQVNHNWIEGFRLVGPNQTTTLVKRSGGKFNSIWLSVTHKDGTAMQGKTSFVLDRALVKRFRDGRYAIDDEKRYKLGKKDRGMNQYYRDAGATVSIKSQPIVNSLLKGETVRFTRTTLKGTGIQTFRYSGNSRRPQAGNARPPQRPRPSRPVPPPQPVQTKEMKIRNMSHLTLNYQVNGQQFSLRPTQWRIHRATGANPGFTVSHDADPGPGTHMANQRVAPGRQYTFLLAQGKRIQLMNF